MKVKDTTYGFHINPSWGQVNAEIYRISKMSEDDKYPLEIHLLSKKFKKFLRPICKEDYKDAREWVDDQMKCIYNSNKI